LNAGENFLLRFLFPRHSNKSKNHLSPLTYDLSTFRTARNLSSFPAVPKWIATRSLRQRVMSVAMDCRSVSD
jgi:hypothetical protein